MKRKPPVVKSLLKNTEASLFAAIEIHNKPIFAYRYEVCTILIINAWELSFKAYIYKYLPKVKLFLKDGTSKPFLECLECVASNLKKDLFLASESIKSLYEFRNDIIHFYGEKMDSIIFSLLQKNILILSGFLKKHFLIDLANKTDLILLPMGFKKIISPLDFLSNDSYVKGSSSEVKAFLNRLVERVNKLEKKGIKDSILVTYSMAVENISRINNADIIAAIDNQSNRKNKIQINKFQISTDPMAQKIKIDDEDEIFRKIFTESRSAVNQYMKSNFICIINKQYNYIKKNFENDPNLFKIRFTYPNQLEKGGTGFFSKQVYREFEKNYKKKII